LSPRGSTKQRIVVLEKAQNTFRYPVKFEYSRKLMGLVQKSVMVEILWSKKAKSAGVLL
jgi:hypothetical protein